MKTTIKTTDIISDDFIVSALKKKLGIPDIFDVYSDVCKVTVDWNIEIYKREKDYSPRFGGYDSYGEIDLSIEEAALCEITVNYYIDENDKGDYEELQFPLKVTDHEFSTSAHGTIQPGDAEIDFQNSTVRIIF